MSKIINSIKETIVIIVSALILSLIIKTLFFQFFFIPSGSMENTLQIKDRVMVNKFATFFSDIKRGEIAVFQDPGNWLSGNSNDDSYFKKVLQFTGVLPSDSKQYLIKRVIGVGGDRVKCCIDGKLVINGEAVNEDYIYPGDKPSEIEFDIKVPKGYIWVLGDHRSNSADSRFHLDNNNGLIPLENVTGRAVFIIWPLNRITLLEDKIKN